MILVAGATGHLGIELVGLLRSRGERVRVLTRNPARAASLLGDDVDLHVGDVCDAASLAPALEGIDTVVSAMTGFGPGGRGPWAVDLKGNANLVAAAEAANAKHFVMVSMHGAREDHPLELYRAKALAEERLQKSSLAWSIIRPTVFMELWVGVVGDSLSKSGKAIVFGRGENPINLVSVNDVARFVCLAVSDPQLRGAAIDVGGPDNVTLNRVVEIVAASRGCEVAARHIPIGAMRAGAFLLRLFKPDIARLIMAAVLMDTTDMSFDCDELIRRFPEVALTHLADAVAQGVYQRRLAPA